MNIDFNKWWNEDDLTTQGNPFTEGTAAYWAWEGWCAGVKAERDAVVKFLKPTEEHRRDASWGYSCGDEGVDMLDTLVASILIGAHHEH